MEMNVKIEARDLRLRYVEADSVLLHEESDPARVKRLTTAVANDGFLRNPPIVSAIDDHVWVVLDGATRTTMLKSLGAEHIPVQVVSYDREEVDLGAWYHVLPEQAARATELFVLAHTDELENDVSPDVAKEMLEKRNGIAAIVRENGTCTVFQIPSKSFGSPFGVLRALVSVYGGAGEIYRVVHEDLVEIVRSNSKCPEVVMFPTFTPSEIQQAALNADLLPAGITRHLITGRALNTNIPLSDILANTSLEAKNTSLTSWLTTKIMEKKVRYYHEPLFVFDD